jgi:hypothetical protein
MTKLTTPKAILIGSFMITLAVLFRIDAAVIEEAKAEVAGMDSRDLGRDRDFRSAVESIVEDCTVGGDVDDDTFYGSVDC